MYNNKGMRKFVMYCTITIYIYSWIKYVLLISAFVSIRIPVCVTDKCILGLYISTKDN